MKRTNTVVENGHKQVIDPEIDMEMDLKTREKELLTPPGQELEEQVQEPLPAQKAPKKGLKKAILAAVGIGAIATAGIFGYNYWQFASTHEETDNATVAGHIINVSSRINGTVTDVLVDDNQQIHKGQLLVKLDPRDLEVKVQSSQAALEAARRQANAAQANIGLSAQTTQGKTATAQGDVQAAVAAISTAQAALREAQAGVPRAQAIVIAAQAGIPTAQAAVREAEAGVGSAQAQLANTEATLQRAQADYNRYQALYQQGAVARQQLETARAAYQVAVAQRNAAQQGIQQAQARVAQANEGVATAQARLDEARVGVASAQAKVAQAQEQVVQAQGKLAASQGGLQQATAGGQQTEVNRRQFEAAQAAISQSEAALKDAQLQLSYTDITAPADGKIGRKSVEVGQRVQAGTPLMAIVSEEHWVTANFKETQLERMKPGQEVEIKLDAFPHHTFKGRVESFSPASGAEFALLPPDNATGNFTKVVQRIPVKVVFDSESIKGYESRISPGMSAVVTVDVKNSPEK
jgi:membrane fusion protein (multidrug efflux system)